MSSPWFHNEPKLLTDRKEPEHDHAPETPAGDAHRGPRGANLLARDQLLTYNDDIQGTAGVALGAILGAVGVTGKRGVCDRCVDELSQGADG